MVNSARSSRKFGGGKIQGGVVMFMGGKGFALRGIPRELLNGGGYVYWKPMERWDIDGR